ncbi:8308_t:CDS:1, partial [Scutellospora calospora]
QDKWDYNSEEFTLYQVLEESIKNIESILKSKYYTTHSYYGDLSELPGRCLLIAKENFRTYFGFMFLLYAIFSLIKDINPNFISIIPGVGEQIVRDIVLKRSYHNEE